ncbi:MAG: OmpA family protein [Candidatus Hydrogenedentes bacterium]|nr:OmpA family protein [Candidatus Hydrogenedentota bacterium]
MAEKHQKHEEHENEERWLLTYADLITLMMVFFVVMYSLSKADSARFQSLSASLSSAFHTPVGTPVPLIGGGGKKGKEPTTRLEKTPKVPGGSGAQEGKSLTPTIEKLQTEFMELVKKENLEGSISVSTSPSGTKLFVRMSDSLLFEPGNATPTPASLPLLGKVAALIAEAKKPVRVEGHTDNRPIHTERYPSNWELSTERASSVIAYLINQYKLSPELLSASGYSEYRPVAPNDTPENRGKNRRVEFVILDENE